MDFSKILDAIELIVDQRVKEAGFTKFITGTIVEVINSEKNIYKITTDNGATCFSAQSIVTNTDSSVAFDSGDIVKLLQLNGTNNSNENIFILGKSENFTQQDLNEIQSYFIKSISVKKQDSGSFPFVAEDSDLINDIKLKRAVGLSVKLKSPSGREDYGFILSLLDSNGNTLTSYKLNVDNMLGEPFKFTDFVEQKLEKYIEDDSVLNKIAKIQVEKADVTFDCKGLEVYSAIWNNDFNDEYSVTFRNPTRVEYLTKKEVDKGYFNLKAILLKNNVTFTTNTCKYLWFKKDPSVSDITTSGYSTYGGVGWRLLNEEKKVTYLNPNTNTTSEEQVIQNNIGNTYQVTLENTETYHNYYKCVVLYGKLKLESETKHILNIDRASKTNLEIYINEDDHFKTTYSKEGFTPKIKFSKISDITNYEVAVNIYAGGRNTEPTTKTIENLSKLPFSLDKVNYTDNYNSYIYVVSLLGETDSSKYVLLEEIEETFYYDGGNEIKTVIQYYDNGSSSVMPSSFDEEKWVNDYTTQIDNYKSKYIIARKRMYGPNLLDEPWEYYWFMVNGDRDAAAQLDEFNKLTNNGKARGLYYGRGYIQTSDTAPVSGKKYYVYDENKSKYKEVFETEFKKNVIYYELDDNDNLYFNADYINTGTLRIGNPDSEKFYASILNNAVKIGGFNVDETSLKSKDETVGISTEDHLIWGGNATPSAAPFYVTTEGALHSTSGDIGGFTINNKTLSWHTGEPDADNKYEQFVELGQDGLKLGKSFQIDQKGNINWNADNSPIKQIYSTVNTTTLPKSLSNVPDNGTTVWHKKQTEEDKYFAQSSDGGKTWAGPYLIQGEKGQDGQNGQDGTSVKIKSIQYAISDYSNQSDLLNSNPEWQFEIPALTQNKYLWTKIIYNDDTVEYKVDRIASDGKDGDKGDPGEKGDKGQDGNGLKDAQIVYGVFDVGVTPNDNHAFPYLTLSLANNNLSAKTPALWQKINYSYTDSTNKIFYYLIKVLPKQTYLKHADSDAFIDVKVDDDSSNVIYFKAQELYAVKDRIYYTYNNGSYSKASSLETGNSLSDDIYYRKLTFDTDKTISDEPGPNTAWLGTYVGYEQKSSNLSWYEYKWSYYLTEINRSNFMSNVLKSKTDNGGNFIDGIYIEEGTDNTKYIGINASAIQAGELAVPKKTWNKETKKYEIDTENDNILYRFRANMIDSKVTIGGFTVDDTSLSNVDNDGYVYLGTEGLKLGGNNENPNFMVDSKGNITWGSNIIDTNNDSNYIKNGFGEEGKIGSFQQFDEAPVTYNNTSDVPSGCSGYFTGSRILSGLMNYNNLKSYSYSFYTKADQDYSGGYYSGIVGYDAQKKPIFPYMCYMEGEENVLSGKCTVELTKDSQSLKITLNDPAPSTSFGDVAPVIIAFDIETQKNNSIYCSRYCIDLRDLVQDSSDKKNSITPQAFYENNFKGKGKEEEITINFWSKLEKILSNYKNFYGNDKRMKEFFIDENKKIGANTEIHLIHHKNSYEYIGLSGRTTKTKGWEKIETEFSSVNYRSLLFSKYISAIFLLAGETTQTFNIGGVSILPKDDKKENGIFVSQTNNGDTSITINADLINVGTLNANVINTDSFLAGSRFIVSQEYGVFIKESNFYFKGASALGDHPLREDLERNSSYLNSTTFYCGDTECFTFSAQKNQKQGEHTAQISLFPFYNSNVIKDYWGYELSGVRIYFYRRSIWYAPAEDDHNCGIFNFIFKKYNEASWDPNITESVSTIKITGSYTLSYTSVGGNNGIPRDITRNFEVYGERDFAIEEISNARIAPDTSTISLTITIDSITFKNKENQLNHTIQISTKEKGTGVSFIGFGTAVEYLVSPDFQHINKIVESNSNTLTYKTNPVIQITGDLLPLPNKTYNLGGNSPELYWNDIYNKNGVINSSDRNVKKDIEQLPLNYETLYDKLIPVRYKFKESTSDRYHIGFISQDVEQALQEADLTSKDFAGFIKSPVGDEKFSYGLRYGEFIALNTDQIQKLKKRVLQLEEELKEIEGENKNET